MRLFSCLDVMQSPIIYLLDSAIILRLSRCTLRLSRCTVYDSEQSFTGPNLMMSRVLPVRTMYTGWASVCSMGILMSLWRCTGRQSM